MGLSQVVVGSDYPYPLGERPAGAVVRNASFLDEAARSQITDGNARRFLNQMSETE
jgi:aminocarboxymuconate-semialdehyde decarboxylase